MADDKNARFRPADPFDREPERVAPASDPLAELARMISRSDPFAELGRDRQPPSAREDGPHARGAAPERHELDEPPYRYRADFPAHDEPAPRHSEPAPPAPHYPDAPSAYGDYHSQRYGSETYSQPDWSVEPPAAPSPAPGDPFALSPQPHLPRTGEHRYETDDVADAQSLSGLEGLRASQAASDPGGYPLPPEQPAYASRPEAYAPEPEAGPVPPPQDDEFYDDVPPARHRKGMLTVAAVLALAVVGTAGAFGYRSFFSSSSSRGAPPVIRAASGPSKVAPPPSTTEQPASKFSYDRFGDRSKDEQVVVREEKPVDTGKLVKSNPPRTVLAGPPIADSLSPNPSSAAAPAQANPPSVLGEPRRVRTVPIRPEAPDPAARPQSMAAAPPAPAAPAPRAETSAVPRVAAPPPPAAETAAPPPPRASSVATRTPPPPARSAARPAPPPPAPAANAPLSLSPYANNNALPPPTVQSRAPSRPPSRPPVAPPTRLASAPAVTASSGASGGYVVQVTSQRSEADAQASFRSIQARYSNILGGHSPMIRRADLGNRGVYYRAMVGPFASRAQAAELCGSLKAAGGDCLVYSN